MAERPQSRAVLCEAMAVFGSSAVLTASLVLLGQLIPFVGENLLALVALVFLYLPVIALRRVGLEAADFGLDRRFLVRGARLGALLTLLTVPPFLVGFHIWEGWAFEHEPELALDNYRQLPETLRVQPQHGGERADGLYLWRRQRHLVVEWFGAGPWALQLETDGLLVHRAGPRPTDMLAPEGTRWQVTSSATAGELVLWVRNARLVTLFAQRGGVPLAPSEVWSGGAFGELESTQPIRLRRSLLWIPLSLLIQILLVALPEEFFYRGYLQQRLDTATGKRRWRIGPFHTSPAILVTSLLFAIGHFVIGFDPIRLSVFFPSLLFGWLRDRSDGLGACILYHAACNLMVELTVVHYWPV